MNEVATIAYENYMDLFCASTVLKGLFGPLAKSVGGPYKTFPVESMKWAHGGFAGWGTVCGSLAGGSLAIGNIVGDTDTVEAMVNDLMFYYSDTVLPVLSPPRVNGPKSRIRPRPALPCATSRSAGGWPRKASPSSRMSGPSVALA